MQATTEDTAMPDIRPHLENGFQKREPMRPMKENTAKTPWGMKKAVMRAVIRYQPSMLEPPDATQSTRRMSGSQCSHFAHPL